MSVLTSLMPRKSELQQTLRKNPMKDEVLFSVWNLDLTRKSPRCLLTGQTTASERRICTMTDSNHCRQILCADGTVLDLQLCTSDEICEDAIFQIGLNGCF